MASLPSSSCSSSSPHKYDVFLSFRGEDTGKKFTDHLYHALVDKRIVTFRDGPDLKRGEEIAPELLKAIQESWCLVIVFSETYAFSGWCLEELAEIVKQKKERGHKVFPIFYDVDPSDLRKQIGKVKEAFAKHEERYKEDKEKIQRWRTALTEVANIAGWDSKDKHEAELIKDIVDEIYKVVPPKLTGLIFHSEDFMPSESSVVTFNQIMKALNANGVSMIGLYGMPGVGKTTLAKKVMKHAIQQKLFDTVVMVTMSQNPDINKIQDRIAESLRLKFEASTEEGKAEELWRRLKAVNKILIIVDDVWKEFDLQTIGIPFDVEHQGCKILLTMRLQQVCVQMGCQEKFELRILSNSEAWTLFKDKADLNDDDSMLNEVAREVASECKGLPLAIVTIGKALKGESLEGWKAANKRFKDSRHLDNEDVCEGLYNRLLLSYDYLKGDNVRSCFLLCSLFPEDCNIGFESLNMLGYGLGLFSGIISFEDFRTEIGAALTKLQDSGLLLESDGRVDDVELFSDDVDENERYVKLHDVIRDFAHWITLREKNIYMVKEGLRQWPRGRFERCTAISFWNCDRNNFPKNLEFPKLKIFIFEGKYFLKTPLCVEGMKALKVLHLTNVDFSLEVLKFMKNLRTLRLENCELQNISSLGNMENLEILALIKTNICDLPEELVTLCALKSLHFSGHFEEASFRPNLLSRLTSLEELHVMCYNDINLSELNSLSALTTLSLVLLTEQCFPENFVFPELQRYIIVINGENHKIMEGLTFRALRIEHLSSSLSAFKKLFCNVEKLNLRDVSEHKNIVPSIDEKGLNELTSLDVRSCDDMEWLMDTTGEKGSITALSNLVELKIEIVDCLKELWHGPPPIRFLQKLKDVYIRDCKQLKAVFPMDGHLATEEISQTELLLSNLTSLDLRFLPKLESIWKLLPTHQYHKASLLSLKVAIICFCPELKSIFIACLAPSLLHLKQLTISYCQGLEQIFDFPQEMAEFEKNQIPPLSNLTSLELNNLPALKWIWKEPTHLVSLNSLRTMRIKKCLKLAYLFTTSLCKSLVHLEVLEIDSCNSLLHVIIEVENEDIDANSLHWPKLKTLRIKNCESLKYVFPITLARGLLNMELVEMCDCFQLKHVFHMTKEKGGHRQQDILLQRLQILRLTNLHNLCSFCPENFIISSVSLKDFRVFNCPRFTTLQSNLKDGVMYLKNLIPDVFPEGLNELTYLTLYNGKDLKCLIDTTDDQGHVSTSAFSNLVELVIQNMRGFKVLCNGPFPKDSLQKLEKLEIRDCMELVSLSSMPQNQSIWKLLPTHQYHKASLLSLTVVIIHDCPKLKSIFIARLAPSLLHLKQLTIASCQELEQIFDFPQEMAEFELKTLCIKNCESLKYVFPITLAQGLPNLELVEICNCSQLKHVFNMTNKNSGHRQRDIPLQRLQILRLENLSNFCSFCPESFIMSSVSLKEYTVFKCPLFTQQIVTKERSCDAKKVTMDGVMYHENLISDLFPEGLNELTSLTLKDGKDMECLIDTADDQGHISTDVFSNLLELVIKNMRGFKVLCNGPFLKDTLQKLEKLEIRDCMELVSLSSIRQKQGAIQVATFQNLTDLIVCNCNRLKSLFSPPLAQNLSKLITLTIEICEGLEEIIAIDDRTPIASSSSQGQLQSVPFPVLKELSLTYLPCLKSFAPVCYNFPFPYLMTLLVYKCPKLVTSFRKDSKDIVHAIQEPQLVEYNTAEGPFPDDPPADYIFWDSKQCPNSLPST
ncbi:hypothetical protein PTKIN_Ptkin14bG0046600 [Pterospermum kingtungense]